jgi:hypothetical protein
MVAKIATGEIEEKTEPRSAAGELGSKGGKARPLVSKFQTEALPV